MENEIQNSVVVNANGNGVANSVADSKIQRITNKDLVKLGFPEFILKKPIGGAEAQQLTNWADAQIMFYNALYTLSKIYKKYTEEEMLVWKIDNSIFLNTKEIIYLYSVKKHKKIKAKNLHLIREIVEELLIKFNNNFEALKQEFARVYAEEKAKIKLDGKEIFDGNLVDKLSQDKKVEYLSELQQIIELLKTEEFSEKDVFFVYKAERFGETYCLKPLELKLRDKLKDMQKYKDLPNIKIYENLLVLYNCYVVVLNACEKQKILNLLTSFKI